LFASFLHNFPKVRDLYARPPHDLSWLSADAASLSFNAVRRARIAAVLERQNRAFNASSEALANIERLRRGACVVVTGQQVGLFGGPLFALLKAITAVRLAAECTARGQDCVPLFWLASEDHDLAEVESAVLPGGDGALHTFTAASLGPEQAPVAAHHFTAQIEQVVGQAAEILGESAIVAAMRQAYQPGVSFGEAFGRLLAQVFGPHGVILLDASDPELDVIAAPVFAEAIRRAAEINAALLARGERLRRDGFHEQVKVTENSTLLFALHREARTAIHRADGQFTLGDESLAAAGLLDRIAAHPAGFSPNVLLRPVVQDYLLPTLAYVGGPAEVAYFAQAAVVYEHLLGHVTPVWPRVSATLVEPHAQRLLERYQLSLADAWHEPDALRALLASRVLPGDLQQSFQSALDSLASSMRPVTAMLERLDPTLVDAAGKAEAKMQYQLTSLQARAAAAEVRRNEVVARHAAQLGAALFPHENLQERVAAGVYFLARYPELLESLRGAISLTCAGHQVLYF
jgi:bacillithiol biosynthesis cysteine-adding enzyme BshC